jgi:hypothetical protein
MTAVGALSSFRKRGEMSPHKRAYRLRTVRDIAIRFMSPLPGFQAKSG